MLNFRYIKDANGQEWLETSLFGKALLTIPQLNKGTAFTLEERKQFGLVGKLPPKVETLEEQITRAYQQYCQFEGLLQKNIYLTVLHNINQTLFFGLVKRHLTEMIPVIYTPIVGTRVKEFSREFRQARGLYITYEDKDQISEILDNRSNPDIDLIVVTDGERILGIGDQGIGGIDIPISKLAMYTFCGAIDPNRTLPIMLDVGTNNPDLLKDPLYLGLRQNRITGNDYDTFVKAFVTAVKEKFPKIFLHWEDFGRNNAHRNLNLYRDVLCSFNDDIQGTGVVTLAALLSAVNQLNSKLSEQRIVIFGAGSAGTGIADQIYAAMLNHGLSEQEARARFWLVDKMGLLTENLSGLTPHQQPYARKKEEIKSWKVKDQNNISFLEVVSIVKPTILIGCSAMSGAFTKEIVQTMAANVARPIIFPLSNPTEKAEAMPADLIAWTDNKALIATGSPFEDVVYKGQKISIAQCNNFFAFPGIGMGTIAVKAKKVSDNMLLVAAKTLGEYTQKYKKDQASLLPSIEDVEHVVKTVALAVAHEAKREGLTTVNSKPIEELIENNKWEPSYLPYRKMKA